MRHSSSYAGFGVLDFGCLASRGIYSYIRLHPEVCLQKYVYNGHSIRIYAGFGALGVGFLASRVIYSYIRLHPEVCLQKNRKNCPIIRSYA